MILAVSNRVCVDGIFYWTDSEVALCWVKGKEKRWKPSVESQVVAIGKDVNCDRWGHIKRVVRPADISTRVCDVKDFDHCSLAILFQIKFKVEGFNATERLELVVHVVNIEAKSDSDKGIKGKGNWMWPIV